MKKILSFLLIIVCVVLSACSNEVIDFDEMNDVASNTVEETTEAKPEFDETVWDYVYDHGDGGENDSVGMDDIDGRSWYNTPLFMLGEIEEFTDNGLTMKLLGFDVDADYYVGYYFLKEVTNQFDVGGSVNVVFSDETLIRYYKGNYEAYSYALPNETHFSDGAYISVMVNSFGVNKDVYSNEVWYGKVTTEYVTDAQEYVKACLEEFDKDLIPIAELPYAEIRIDKWITKGAKFYNEFEGTWIKEAELDFLDSDGSGKFFNLIYKLPNDDKVYIDSPSINTIPEGTTVKIFYTDTCPVALEIVE